MQSVAYLNGFTQLFYTILISGGILSIVVALVAGNMGIIKQEQAKEAVTHTIYAVGAAALLGVVISTAITLFK